jgi:hypothetical protein
MKIKTLLIFLLFSVNSFAQMPQEWPYEIGRPLDNHFYELSKKYKLVKSISNKGGIKNIKLFVDTYNSSSENGSDENSPTWNHNAIIQVNEFYYEFLLGQANEAGSYDIIIKDVAGLKKRNEIIVNSGCHEDGGCLDNSFIIFDHESGPISVIKLDTDTRYETNVKTGEVVLSTSMLFEENSGNCYSISQSYKLSRYSIVKTKTIYKKRKIECAG